MPVFCRVSVLLLMIKWRHSIIKVLWIHEPHLCLGDDLGFDSAGIVRTGVVFRCNIFGTIWGPERPHFIAYQPSFRSCLVFHHGEWHHGCISKQEPSREVYDITIRSNFADLSLYEVQNIQRWSIENRMTLNVKKTWEMVVRGDTKKATHDGYWEEGGTQVIGSNNQRGAIEWCSRRVLSASAYGLDG